MQPWDRRGMQAVKTLKETRTDLINMTKGLYLETKHRRARGQAMPTATGHCGDGVRGAYRAAAGQPEYWGPSGQQAVSATSFQQLPCPLENTELIAPHDSPRILSSCSK